MAPEGHRPRPRGLVALAHLGRRRHDLRPLTAQVHLQGQPQGAARRAARSALSVHAERASIAVFDPAPFDTPSTKNAAALLADSGLGFPTLIVLTDAQERAALSFRNLERVSVLPVSMVGVADLIGAAAVVVSQEALDALTARAKGESPERRGRADAVAEEAEA